MIRLPVTAIAFAMLVCLASPAWSMSIEEACGVSNESLAGEAPGRWLSWYADSVSRQDTDPATLDKQTKLLTEISDLFMDLPVLSPPPGVEMRAGLNLGKKGWPDERIPSAELSMLIFHPTYKKAGEASASIRVVINNPLSLGIDSEIRDKEGSMAMEPIEVGELGGASVYWTEGKGSCILVYKGNAKPLWKPVSQERFLRAHIDKLESQIEKARSEFAQERKKQQKSSGGMSAEQQEEMLRQMEATNPEAAKQMRQQFEEMRRQMDAKTPQMQADADRDFAQLGSSLAPEIEKFKAELAAMTPAERAAPAYVGGAHASRVSMLSKPDDEGSRAMVTANSDYFAANVDPSTAQLLTIELHDSSHHAPERAILGRVLKEMEWQQLDRFTGQRQ